MVGVEEGVQGKGRGSKAGLGEGHGYPLATGYGVHYCVGSVLTADGGVEREAEKLSLRVCRQAPRRTTRIGG